MSIFRQQKIPAGYIRPAGQVTAQQLVLDAFWFVIPNLLFLLALYLLMSRYPLLPRLGWARGIWITAVLVVNRVFTWGG